MQFGLESSQGLRTRQSIKVSLMHVNTHIPIRLRSIEDLQIHYGIKVQGPGDYSEGSWT